MKVLALFCGTGGASYGIKLNNSNHYIVGVDNNPKLSTKYTKHCGDEFIQRNVLSLPTSFLKEFDFIWASPPCQNYVTTAHRTDHPNLIPPVRHMLMKADVPWCIENIPQAPLFKFITLCGTMF